MVLKTPISEVVESVLASLNKIDGVSRYLLAFSGGVDSYVLLHVLAAHRYQFGNIDFQAIHINHGLNKNSDQWAQRCQQICEQIKVAFVAIDADATPRTGESPEARARTVRYEAISRLIKPGDCLLTAHHQDDQVETLLLQLMRGSGPKGLAAMPEVSTFKNALIARPLIHVRREAIQSYAIKHQLKWIDDDSNRDIKYDRNFIRHEIIPRLQQRWPSLSQTVSRSARYCAEAAEILEAFAHKAIDQMGADDEALSVSALQQYNPAEQKNILRYWFQRKGLNIPSSAQMDQVVDQVLNAAIDATPRLTWEGSEVRRYRDKIYALLPLKEINIAEPVEWDLQQPLELANAGALKAIEKSGEGVARKYLENKKLSVSFRQGGESIQPVGRKEKHTLKNLFQEAGVPPWVRERTPLIYVDGELAAVGELFVSHRFQAQDGEDSYIFQWKTLLQGASA